MENSTMAPMNATAPYLHYEEASLIDKYTTPIIWAIGFPGNIISLIIWMQKRMRHSSGYYLAALALDDLIFLACSILFELQETWRVKALYYPVLCEVYPVIYLSSQYISPFLVLAFTTERYISICHPFAREKYCTVKRAKVVIVCLIIFALCLTGVNGYFFTTLKNEKNETICTQRTELTENRTTSVLLIYNTCSEMLAFLVVPVSVLVLNVLVIREMRRLSRVEQTQLHGSSQRTGATTVMLLAVSFYQIITTLPISIVYALSWEFDYNESNMDYYGPERAAKRYRVYHLVLWIIKEYGITHYAFNIFIYIITGKMFRQELKKLFLRPFNKLASRLPTNYSSLRTSDRASKTWVSVNGKNNHEKSTNETLL